MCNVYRIEPRRSSGDAIAQAIAEAVSKLAETLPSSLIRKTDPGLVALPGGRIEAMRWGFHRDFNPAVNNARADKLDSGMWREAIGSRRCAVPMSCFYEWGPAPEEGRDGKQAHEFREPEGGYLWVAGVWEEHPGFGRCFSIVTTGSAPPMTGIHHRMPALLEPREMEDYLESSIPWPFHPYQGPLETSPCESPLAKRPPAPEGGTLVQGELF